ncbi:MAG: hypothetical protein LBT56_06965 [Prevotellaceae bacterium]|nr:hypothetical protein [Prevotellaceae bacterium]
MNVLLLAIICVAATTIFTSCDSDDVKPTPSFYIEEDYSNLIIEHTAYNTASPYHYYTVRAVGDWQVVPLEEYSWVQAFPNQGKDEGVFRIIAKANDNINQRVAYFKIIAAGAEQPVLITVTQKENEPYITVTVRNAQGTKEQKPIIDIPGPTEQSFFLFVKSNIQWDIMLGDNAGDGEDGDSSGDVDWIDITRVDGDSIRVDAERNMSDATRTALITFFYTDNPNIKQEITIRQEPGSYMKVPTALFGISKLSKVLNVAVDANIPWTAVSNDSWINLSSTTETAAVLNVLENNTGSLRIGTVTFTSPIDPVRFNITVTINQDELGEMTGFEEPIEWEFTAAHYNANAYNTQFVDNNILKSGLGAAVATGTSNISYVVVGGLGFPGNTNVKRVVGTTGHPYVTGAWTDDYWLFKVPVTNLRIGTKINIKFITRSSATGHKYWMLECYDGTEWKVVGEMKTDNVGGAVGTVNYTHAMNADGATNVQVNSTYLFTNSIPAGDVQFRFRCMANCQAGSGAPLASPNGGTHRLAGAADGTSPVISLVP